MGHGAARDGIPAPALAGGALAAALLAGCTGPDELAPPPVETFCQAAQELVTNTTVPATLVIHEDFDAFVKSKTSMEPLTIHEYVWYEDEARTKPVMISCKLKSADHINEVFGPGTAGPDGRCQDFNRMNYVRIRATDPDAGDQTVVFDPGESVFDPANPGMAGPNWLKPFELTAVDAKGQLHVRSKSFQVDWKDPRFAELPGKFRGVHYCHFIAPAYLDRLLKGEAEPGLLVGRSVQ